MTIFVPLSSPSQRASRETELAERFPLHVVAEWLGNSPKTALAHYTQVTEEHYRLAAGGAAQNQAQLDAARPSTEQQTVLQGDRSGVSEAETLQGVATGGDYLRDYTNKYLVTPTGFEPVSRP